VYGARHYYGKAPGQLSEREVLELLVISRSPSAYSPSAHPERFRRAVESLAAQLGTLNGRADGLQKSG
jgi:membrane peptidoglycan carboxypeptidase